MKVLVLGVGMQGKAALHDLVENADVEEVVAADRDAAMLDAHADEMGYGDRVRFEELDVANPAGLERLMAEGPDVVIDLLPPSLIGTVARSAVDHGVHLVNTMYATPELGELAAEAEESGVTLLPELGMDPGIDLVLLGEGARQFDRIDEILSYGSGIPVPEDADNPLRYKVSWTFDGVLRSYDRPARVIQRGKVVRFDATEIFDNDEVHRVEVDEVGSLEAYPNGDVLDYVNLLGLDHNRLGRAGRYTMRYPGHCAFWNVMARLHLLDDAPILVEGVDVDKKEFLSRALEPQLRYGEDERDLAILRVEVAGLRDGEPARLVLQVVDRRDLETGFTAMSRLVGFSASIGAQMIGRGQIDGPGLLSPLRDVPYHPFTRALANRGIEVVSWLEE